MTIDTVDNIVPCLVILHSICMEDLLEKDGQINEDEDIKTARVACKEKLPMWGGLVCFSTSGTTSSLGLVADLNDMKS